MLMRVKHSDNLCFCVSYHIIIFNNLGGVSYMYRYNESKDYFDNLDNFYTEDEDYPQYRNDYEHYNYTSSTDYITKEDCD